MRADNEAEIEPDDEASNPLTHADAIFEDKRERETALSAYLKTFVLPGTETTHASGKKKARLGMCIGVYLPTIQNVFGVLMFLRLFWLTGVGGALFTTILVVSCCLVTFFTSISMSAIVTNGVVEGGGSYFMISRNLGVEFGAAVGILFYLANTIAVAMYLVGGIEILVTYMAPEMSISSDKTMNGRLYASALLVVVFLCVLAGVKFVQCFAPISLFCVILSIVAVFAGCFSATFRDMPDVCMVNDRLLHWKAWNQDEGNISFCYRAAAGPLFDEYCESNGSKIFCDEAYIKDDPGIRLVPAFPGLGSSAMGDNLMNNYINMEKGDALPGVIGKDMVEVTQDVKTSFFILMGIYFPSVTGILTGSNMSGDLKNPQKSLPLGTIAAQLTTSFVYVAYIWLFAGTINGAVLRDKYGDSLNGRMVIGALSWPHDMVLLVGSFTSTFGAGLQSLCSAPRLIQAIAKDDVVPFLKRISSVDPRGEPVKALLVTTAISEVFILIGQLDYIAPIVNFFFLISYAFINLACALQTIMRSPNWRPRYKYYHWSLSTAGFLLAVFIMFATNWAYGLFVTALCAYIYQYVKMKGAKKEWGDGIRGLALSSAQFALMRVEDADPHPKNWRPQLLIFMKPTAELQPKYERLFTIAGQLKAGRGLTMVYSLLKGDPAGTIDESRAQELLKKTRGIMNHNRVKGYARVVLCPNDMSETVLGVVQAAGVGALRPNTVVIGFPHQWGRHCDKLKKSTQDGEDNMKQQDYFHFLDTIHRVATNNMCLLIPKGVDTFPDSHQRLKGTIDVWWIIEDGGLLLLIPFLLRKHKVWRACKLRIFTVCSPTDNSDKMHEDLTAWCYQLRIDAAIEIVEMDTETISAYVYERTMRMEERFKYLQALHLSQNEQKKLPQQVYEQARKSTPDANAKTDSVGASGRFKVSKVDETQTSESVVPPTKSQSKSYSTRSEDTSTYSESAREAAGAEKVSRSNVRRMHTAIDLNKAMRAKSSDAQLVVVNLPRPPRSHGASFGNYLEYLEALTEGIKRVMLVRGSGKEVITMYS